MFEINRCHKHLLPNTENMYKLAISDYSVGQFEEYQSVLISFLIIFTLPWNLFLQLQVDSFLHIVKVACGPEVEQYFAESKFERLQIHCAAAAYQMSLAKAAKERESKQKALTQATVHLNKAITIDYNEQLPILGLGQVALIKVSFLLNISLQHMNPISADPICIGKFQNPLLSK